MKPKLILEINGALALPEVANRHKWNENYFKPKHNCKWTDLHIFPEWLQFFLIPIGEKLKQIEGYDKYLRIFRDLPPQWITPQITTYDKKGLGKTPTVGLNMPVVNRMKTLIKTAVHNGFDGVIISMLDNCSQRERGWSSKYYSDEWWNKYHMAHIHKLTNELKKDGLQKYIIAETCNEGHGGIGWENGTANFLKELGYKTICASPEHPTTFAFLLAASSVDFLPFHGIWTKAKWKVYLQKYSNNGKIIPSGDGFSDCSGANASRWYQFDEKRYGKLPTANYVEEQFKKCKNVGIDLNLSGALERPDPRLGLILGWLDKIIGVINGSNKI